jgi:iron complex outermembrane receptor protein
MLSLLMALALVAAPVPAAAPVAAITGVVTDTSGAPLVDVRVTIVEANRSTRTDAEGRFAFYQLARGTYGLSFARIGYAPQVHRVRLDAEDSRLAVALVPSLVELPPIQVTSSPLATNLLDAPQPTSVVSAEDLSSVGAPSLGETVNVLPGVRNYSTGVGIGKPVIRGLTSNRVLVLADGQRLESQQWGDEHGPNVETADAARIEVIRGPASVLYGSDALGGVINVIDRDLPEAIGIAPFVRGRVQSAYHTGTRMPEGTVALEGASGGLGVRGSVTGRKSGDLRTPDGPLANSAAETLGGDASLGLRGPWGAAHLSFAHRDERLEIHEDPAEEPDATPFQKVTDDRFHFELGLPAGLSHLDIDAGYERNHRREFESAEDLDFALGLTAETWTTDVRLHHTAVGPVEGILGVSGVRSSLAISGEEVLVPAHRATSAGLYASEQASFGRFDLSAGARLDLRRLDVDQNLELGVEQQVRNYDALSGSFGVLYHTSPSTAVVLNVGRGFRAPSAFELFANGVHEGTVRYERGDATLDTETSLNTDLAFRVQSNHLRAEFGGFVNLVDNFIYPDPSGLADPESGFAIYDFRQADARLLGIEAVAEYHPIALIHLRATADWVRGENRELDQPLPFVPPLRVTYGAGIEADRLGLLLSPHLSVQAETNARQERLDPDDVAPPGYTLAHAGAGFNVAVGAQVISVNVQARNLFNTRYASFLSRYKAYALDGGRNIILRVGTSF